MHLPACSRCSKHRRTSRCLAPLIEREILYRLATGPAAELMRHIATTDSSLARISDRHRLDQGALSPALHHRGALRAGGNEPVIAPRSLQGGHAHEPSSVSLPAAPSGGAPADGRKGSGGRPGRISSRLESPSQFSREYVRLYGAAPAADAAQVRQEGATAIGSPTFAASVAQRSSSGRITSALAESRLTMTRTTPASWSCFSSMSSSFDPRW